MPKCPQCGSDFAKDESRVMAEYHINLHVSGEAQVYEGKICVDDVEPINDDMCDEHFHPIIGKVQYFCENCGRLFTKKEALKILNQLNKESEHA